jgi:hypothetical protein
MVTLREREMSSDPAHWPDTPAATDAKAQRLMAAALRKGDSLERDNELYLAIEAFTAADFRRLLTDLGALKAMGEKLSTPALERNRILAFGLVERWLAVDPDSAMTWAGRVIDLIPAKAPARGLILDAVSAKRPAEMLALVSRYKDAGDRAEIISRALRKTAADDPAKARAWLAGCTDPADRRAAEKAIRMGRAEADPLRAIELAGSIDDPQESQHLLDAAMSAAERMGPGVLRQMATTPMKPWMLGTVLNDFAMRDPEIAVDLALKSGPSGQSGLYSLQKAFSALAQKDHGQAIEKLDGLTGPELAAAVGAIGNSWAAAEPIAALAWLAERPESERANPIRSMDGINDTLLIVFRGWAGRARDEATAWADALPAGAMRDSVQTQLARAMAERGDVAEATQVLARLGRTADPNALREIASEWARRDPVAAADWAIAQPPGPAQSGALAGIVGSWADDEPDAVKEWLAQFPPGEARDRSIAAYLNRSTAWLAGAAARTAEFNAWFDRIDDPWQRARTAQSLFLQRKQSDPVGAYAWLSSLTNVDPELIRMTLRDHQD